MKQISAVIFFGLLACPVLAKPILKDTQQSYFSACLQDDLPPEEQLAVCQEALADPGPSPAQRHQIRVEVGDALYALRRYAAAEVQYREVLLDAPETVEALNGLGWVHWSRDQYPEAVAVFRRSIAVAPSAQGLSGLGASRRQMDDITAEGFVELLDAALALSPRYGWARREKGWGLMDFGRPAEAEAAFRAALDDNERDQWAAYGLGYALNEQDRYAEALEVLLRVEPDDQTPTGYYSQLSLTRYQLGDYKEALKNAERTIAGWPDDSTGYVRKARALEALGNRAEGIALLRSRAAEGQDDFLAYWLADLLYAEGQLQEALDVARETLEAGTPDRYDLELHAFLALEAADFAGAWSSVNRVLEAEPQARYGLYYKALLQVEAGDFDASEVTMRAALESGLPDRRTMDYLSALMAQGEYVRAIQFRRGGDGLEDKK